MLGSWGGGVWKEVGELLQQVVMPAEEARDLQDSTLQHAL